MTEDTFHAKWNMSTPWPIAKRQWDYTEKIVADTKTGEIYVMRKNVANPFVSSSHVSISSDGCGIRFRVNPKDQNEVEISYLLSLEMEGRVPKWFLKNLTKSLAKKFVSIVQDFPLRDKRISETIPLNKRSSKILSVKSSDKLSQSTDSLMRKRGSSIKTTINLIRSPIRSTTR